MKENKRNVLNLSDSFLNSLTKIERYRLPLIVSGDIVFSLAFLGLGAFLIYESIALPIFLPVGILCLISVLIYLSSIYFLKKEKLYAGALISTIGILFACMIILDVCPPDENPLVYYRSGCFVAVMAVCNQVVSFKRRQIKIFNYCVLLMWIVMVIRTAPYTVADLPTTISSIGINSLGVTIANLLITSSNKFNIMTLENEIVAEQEANKTLTSITQVLEESRNGLSVGKQLMDETQKADSNINAMNTLYSNIIEGASGLSLDAGTVSDSSTKVLTSAEQMKKTAYQQNDLITNTSNALVKISGNISDLSELAEQRSANMKQVMDIFTAEKTLMNEIIEKVNKVEESSKGIEGFVKTVNAIANQTNLLAMNASIEAAHAGVVGKGFSVIAQEIRKLSIQTSSNAAQITEELNKNAEIVKSTTESVNSFGAYIHSTTQEMENFIEMIENLIHGIQTINNENTNVMSSLQDVVSQSNETKKIVDDVASEIVGQDQILTNMHTKISNLKTDIDSMNIQLQNFQTIIGNIDTEAKQNISVSRNINKYLQ